MIYLVSPEGASMVDAGGENFVFLFSRAEKNVLLDVLLKNFDFMP